MATVKERATKRIRDAIRACKTALKDLDRNDRLDALDALATAADRITLVRIDIASTLPNDLRPRPPRFRCQEGRTS
jgi:hypothetical protein